MCSCRSARVHSLVGYAGRTAVEYDEITRTAGGSSREPATCMGGTRTKDATRTDRRRMMNARRGAGRRLRAMWLSMGLLLAGGCGEVTWWDAQGSWSGTVTLPGEAAAQRTSGLSDPEAGSTEDRVRLCELSTMVLGLTFVPIERDRPAAIEVRTARPLCHEGRTQITGGAVLIWSDPGSDANVLSAARSGAWTVTGEIEITSYQSEALPDLDAGDTANTERIEGRLSLTATDDAGSVIRIDGATFHLTVVASRVKLSIT